MPAEPSAKAAKTDQLRVTQAVTSIAYGEKCGDSPDTRQEYVTSTVS